MVPDKEGFLYPVIDDSKCINCKLCEKVHEERLKITLGEPLKCYAMRDEDLMKPSSGGIAHLLSKRTILAGGIVYGAVFDGKAKHVRCEKTEELDALRGSKYAQSEIGLIYKSVQKDLNDKRPVLFIGTPCQIEGLRAFVKKDYDNLLTVDVVCHGAPSNQMLNDYLDTICTAENLQSLTFRDKSKGWGINGAIYLKDGSKKPLWASASSYLSYFLDGSLYRDSCYECRFTSKNRPGDITLGDYWGIEKMHPEFNSELGVSAVICNTEKGKKAIGEILDKVEYVESTFEKIAEANTQLREPAVNKNPRIKEIYAEEGWKGIDREFQKKSWLDRNKSQLKSLIPTKIKKVLKRAM